MADRHFEEVPVVIGTPANLKKVQAQNLTQLLNVFDGKKGIEQRWVKARPVINFLEVEGDGGELCVDGFGRCGRVCVCVCGGVPGGLVCALDTGGCRAGSRTEAGRCE